MMKITYIGHSGFFVEMEDACFLFDYYKGTIPETDGNKKMYVFVSHRHHDHYNEEIFRLQEKFRDIQYIISSDVYELADFNQTVKAITEAEAYPGPSLIIAYAPCINHGIKKGMSKAQTEEQLAVECGYWNNFRFNPGAEGDKFFLDSKEPKKEDYQAFLDGEVRYNALKRANPEKAEKLFAINEQEAMERYAYLKKLVDVYKAEE